MSQGNGCTRICLSYSHAICKAGEQGKLESTSSCNATELEIPSRRDSQHTFPGQRVSSQSAFCALSKRTKGRRLRCYRGPYASTHSITIMRGQPSPSRCLPRQRRSTRVSRTSTSRPISTLAMLGSKSYSDYVLVVHKTEQYTRQGFAVSKGTARHISTIPAWARLFWTYFQSRSPRIGRLGSDCRSRLEY